MTFTNIINTRDAVVAARSICRGIRDPRVVAWFEGPAATWLRKNAECAVPVPPGTGGLPKWALDDLARGRPVHRFVLSPSARDVLVNIAHWLKDAVKTEKKDPTSDLGRLAAKDLAKLRKVSVPEATQKANAWYRRSANAARKALRSGAHPTTLDILPIDKNLAWERLTTYGMVEAGYEMLNCLRHGDYRKEVERGLLQIWALRDMKGEYSALLTVDKRSNEITELKAKNNEPAYGRSAAVVAFANALKLKINGFANDFTSIGIIYGKDAWALPAAETIDPARDLVLIDSTIVLRRHDSKTPTTQRICSIKTQSYPPSQKHAKLRNEAAALDVDALQALSRLLLKNGITVSTLRIDYPKEMPFHRTAPGLIPWMLCIARETTLEGERIIELTDGRVIAVQANGEPVVIAGSDWDQKNNITYGFRIHDWNRWPASVRELSKKDPVAFWQAIDPGATRLQPESMIDPVLYKKNHWSNDCIDDVIPSEGRWIPTELAWKRQNGYSLGCDIDVLRSNVVTYVRGMRPDGSLLFKGFVEAGSFTVEGTFDGNAALARQVVAWIAQTHGVPQLEVEGLPVFLELDGSGLPQPVSGKTRIKLEAGGEILKAKRHWFGIAEDGRFLWAMPSPIKGRFSVVTPCGAPEESAAHFAATVREFGLSADRSSVADNLEWLAEGGYFLVNGVPVPRPFAGINVIDLAKVRWERRIAEDEDASWDLKATETGKTIARAAAQQDGTLWIDFLVEIADYPFWQEALAALTAATGLAPDVFALATAGRLWRNGALHAPSPGEPLALWNEGRIALGAGTWHFTGAVATLSSKDAANGARVYFKNTIAGFERASAEFCLALGPHLEALGAFLGSLRQNAPVAEAQPETELRTPANDTMEKARMSA